MTAAILAFTVVESAAEPQDPPPGPSSATSEIHAGARALAHKQGSGIEADMRHAFRSGFQLGVLGGLGHAPRSYASGHPIDDVVIARGALVLVVPTIDEGSARFFLRFVHGAAALSSENLAWRQTNEIGAFAHVAWGARNLFRAGAVLGADLEVSPTVELADQYQGLTAGYGFAVSRSALVYADAAVGSTYGFNGDNGKVYYGGSLGVRLHLGKGDARGAF